MVCELYFNKAVTLKKKVGFEKEESIVREQKRLEDKLLPEDIDYSAIKPLNQMDMKTFQEHNIFWLNFWG